MESTRKNLQDLTNIPETEFKEHFREWMDQDHVARSLQAKLRKDLISNFNKTTLGKNIIAQAALSNRLTLSPLILALNTLVAEFLYAQNCHFTLSVFCTEVPYRNTLPDFESMRRFRFNKREIFEIFDALCCHWEESTKDDICKEYLKQNCSLLFVVLKGLLSKPNESATKDNRVEHVEPTMPTGPSKEPQKLESKMENQNNHFRYLNKYLITLSKKVKEMSQNMKQLQKQKSGPHPERKSIQARKFENLNRSLARISENLKQMSVSKRKNKKLTAVVTAINAMSKQFERCVINFDHISKGLGKAGSDKSYSDWIKEMRSTNNGKRFLEKIESALRKTLHKEKDKMEHELEQRLQVQKDILKTKYKQKLAEELAKHTSRSAVDETLKANESFEKKLSEYEAKHQELHERIHETERKVLEAPMSRLESHSKQPVPLIDNKCTQTATASKPENPPVNTHKELQQMVKTISEQERQFDHIVFDAKLRIQELEHESNQLDRTFRDYLERQHSEKEKLRETATSIWKSYALGKSMLDRKCSALHSTSRTMGKLPVASIHKPKTSTQPAPTIPIINIETSTSMLNPSSMLFENPFRTAQKKVLTRSKTLPQPAVSTDTESSGDKHPRHQRPSVLRLIEHSDIKASETQPNRPPTTAALLSPELNIKDITLDGIEISTTTAKSSTPRSCESNGSSTSPRGVFKLRRQLFTATDNGGPSRSTNGRQMNSNGNKEAEEPLKQINGENTDIGARRKPIDVKKKDVAVNKENQEGDGNSKEHSTEPRGVKILDAPLSVEEKDAS